MGLDMATEEIKRRRRLVMRRAARYLRLAGKYDMALIHRGAYR